MGAARTDEFSWPVASPPVRLAHTYRRRQANSQYFSQLQKPPMHHWRRVSFITPGECFPQGEKEKVWCHRTVRSRSSTSHCDPFPETLLLVPQLVTSTSQSTGSFFPAAHLQNSSKRTCPPPLASCNFCTRVFLLLILVQFQHTAFHKADEDP